MTDKPENPRAFARTAAGYDPATGDYCHKQEGMTLRDYFAGQAPCIENMGAIGLPFIDEESPAEHLARSAYIFADAMLAERAKQ